MWDIDTLSPLSSLAPVGRIPCLRFRASQAFNSKSRQEGCMHCVSCLDGRSSRSKVDSSPRHESRELWPGQMRTPTVYFHLRARQLEFLASLACSSLGRERAWRAGTCCPSALLQRRARPQLELLLPRSYTNISESDSVVLLGQFIVTLQRSGSGLQQLPAATATTQVSTPPQSPASHCTAGSSDTSSFSFTQPAKRTRLCSPEDQAALAALAVAPMGQQQQQQQQGGHELQGSVEEQQQTPHLLGGLGGAWVPMRSLSGITSSSLSPSFSHVHVRSNSMGSISTVPGPLQEQQPQPQPQPQVQKQRQQHGMPPVQPALRLDPPLAEAGWWAGGGQLDGGWHTRSVAVDIPAAAARSGQPPSAGYGASSSKLVAEGARGRGFDSEWVADPLSLVGGLSLRP